MKTDFFTNLAKLGTSQITFSISFSETDNRMTVSVIPSNEKKDNAVRQLQPLTVTAEPTELDEQFFEVASEPIKQTISLISNTNKYLEQKAITEKNTQAEKDKKEKTAKIVKEINSLLTVEEERKENTPKIKKLILELKAIDPNSKEAISFTDELLKETEQNSLFV